MTVPGTVERSVCLDSIQLPDPGGGEGRGPAQGPRRSVAHPVVSHGIRTANGMAIALQSQGHTRKSTKPDTRRPDANAPATGVSR
jgi:hypothetical protein